MLPGALRYLVGGGDMAWLVLAAATTALLTVLVGVARRREPAADPAVSDGSAPMQAPVGRPRLVISDVVGVDRRLIGRAYALGETSVIGSESDCDVCIDVLGVSRRHAGIRRYAGAWEIADFGSSGGLYVNGSRVNRERLADGDVLRIGPVSLRVESVAGKADQGSCADIDRVAGR